MRRSFLLVAAVVFPLCAAPQQADAWGALGHRIVSGAAMRALPSDAPAFLRTADAIDEVRMLGPEADRIKGAGRSADADADPGHFVDLADDGTVAGVPIDPLPPSREAYDTALRAKNTDQYKQGFLPYSMLDGYQVVAKDFVWWRLTAAGERVAASDADRAFWSTARRVREALLLRDIGFWGHFVGDASQPLHASIHYNGWGDGPNPNGYSNSHTIHSRFETALVNAVATEDAVFAAIPPYRADGPAAEALIATELRESVAAVPDVYRLEAAGGIDGQSADAKKLVLSRLAAGAATFRDLIVRAWTASATGTVAYPPIKIQDIESGAVAPTRAMLLGNA